MRYETFLTADEIKRVVGTLRSKRAASARWQLILFRLSCCCGLRRSEISQLRIGDITIDGPRPGINVRAETTKGRNGVRRSRYVPLWWDQGTLADIAAWVRERGPEEFVVASTARGSYGNPVHPATLAKRWRSAIKCLGPSRVKQVSIHKGRHSFITHSLTVGRSLAEVMSAAGHSSIGSTDVYTHFLNRDNVPDVFAMEGK